MPDDRAEGGLGRKLREARDRRGLSLRQIADSTKISIGFLEALERNDPSRLPGGIFGRSFVRAFASAVGLNPDEAVREFVEQSPIEVVSSGHQPTRWVEDADEVEGGRRMALTFLQLAALSVPIAIAVLYFSTAGRPAPSRQAGPVKAPGSQSRSPESRAQRPASEPNSAPAGAAVAPPGVSRPVAGTVGTVAGTPRPGDARLSVTLSATRPCWIAATVDGRTAVYRVVQAGERESLEVDDALSLRIGDAGALTVTLNGAETKPFGRDGEVVTARVTPANFKDFLQTR